MEIYCGKCKVSRTKDENVKMKNEGMTKDNPATYRYRCPECDAIILVVREIMPDISH